MDAILGPDCPRARCTLSESAWTLPLKRRWTRRLARGVEKGGVTPYTLHPTPCTLHSTPYTLHPTPFTLHPAPYTLHSTPYTLHPTLYTLRPTPYNYILGPEP